MRGALDRLAAVGLQSDAEFAETFARSKWRQSKWGPRRIEGVSLFLLPAGGVAAGRWLGLGRARWVLAAPTLTARPPTLQELHHRGVSEELASAAVNAVFGEGLNLRQHLEQLEEQEGQGGYAAGGWAAETRAAADTPSPDIKGSAARLWPSQGFTLASAQAGQLVSGGGAWRAVGGVQDEPQAVGMHPTCREPLPKR